MRQTASDAAYCTACEVTTDEDMLFRFTISDKSEFEY